jgi:hypothetical protein
MMRNSDGLVLTPKQHWHAPSCSMHMCVSRVCFVELLLLQVLEIQLSNPTRRPLSYAARLEGAADFSLEASLVKIDPGQSTQVPVKFSPSTSLPKACRLVLMSRRDSAASAATLVFLLKGQADVRVPLKQVNVAAQLYQLTTQELVVSNPFPAGEQSRLVAVRPTAHLPVVAASHTLHQA